MLLIRKLLDLADKASMYKDKICTEKGGLGFALYVHAKLFLPETLQSHFDYKKAGSSYN